MTIEAFCISKATWIARFSIGLGVAEIAKRLKKLLPQNMQDNVPPQIRKMIREGAARIKQLEHENEQLKADRSLEAQELRLKVVEGEIKKMLGFFLKAKTDMFKAENDRMETVQPKPGWQGLPAI